VREDGSACAPGEVGEIVSTSLIREAQPFVRYRTGDLGVLAAEACPCGRPMPVLASLEGRVDDVVLGTDGRRVSRMSIVPKGLAGIRATQFVQERPGALAIRVLADGELTQATVDTLIQRVRERVGSDTQVDVTTVDELERTSRGKVRGVISRVGTP
jgi:phenylacetate-CoA ligase